MKSPLRRVSKSTKRRIERIVRRGPEASRRALKKARQQEGSAGW